MNVLLEFEKPIVELKRKLRELEAMSDLSGVDHTEAITALETRIQLVEDTIFSNLKPWDRVQIARHQNRPTTHDYIGFLFEDFFECKGDRVFGEDEAIIGGIARYHGMPVTVIGHQRGKDTKENIRRNFGMPHPEGYRKSLRLMRQAEKFGRPVICFIDTKGAYPGKAAEERGQSEAIARNLFEMAGLKVPIVCIVIGEGGSGGALALGVGDRLLMLENSTYSVISPEGAASILWRDASRAKEAAASMKITAQDLKTLGIIDSIIEEVRGGAHCSAEEQALLIDKELLASLHEVMQIETRDIVKMRYQKFKQIGRDSFVLV